jgi:hypothetical protein
MMGTIAYSEATKNPLVSQQLSKPIKMIGTKMR